MKNAEFLDLKMGGPDSGLCGLRGLPVAVIADSVKQPLISIVALVAHKISINKFKKNDVVIGNFVYWGGVYFREKGGFILYYICCGFSGLLRLPRPKTHIDFFKNIGVFFDRKTRAKREAENERNESP